ncbi:MAG TPA: SPOR domain-containing protein [Edaphobacter sp.]|nr:SPOR domain-containing protein [Edaphobacter sp.]
MNTRYENDLYEPAEQDREISLSTTTILGIFFALALLCAVFFGFGYSMGRKSAQPVSGASSEVTTKSENTSSKPSPGSPAIPSTSSAARQSETQSAITPPDSTNLAGEDSPHAPSPIKAAVPSPRTEVPAELPTRSAIKPAGIIPVAASLPSPGSSVVQVAAMSHQEDADVVAVDLKRRGYAVAVRHEPQDKLFHVQIGPFSNKKEADAMRQRLQTDGYNNAIVK